LPASAFLCFFFLFSLLLAVAVEIDDSGTIFDDDDSTLTNRYSFEYFQAIEMESDCVSMPQTQEINHGIRL
jgi:hypothetical protein